MATSSTAEGECTREWVLREDDLGLPLVKWSKTEKRVTTKSTRRYVNDLLFSGEGGMLKLAQYHLTLSISEFTVDLWMTKLGYTFERHGRSHYTGVDDRSDVWESGRGQVH